MAITDPTDTLAYHRSRVLTSHRDMSDVPLASVTGKVAAYLAAHPEPKAVPEKEALAFYGLNHGMSLISAEYDPLQPLKPEDLAFVSDYHATLGPKAVMAFYYLLLICTREARHNKSLKTDVKEMTKQFGTATASFFDMSGNEDKIHEKLLSNPPETTIGNFVDCIRWQFYNSLWSSGYGGKAWGQVTDCLRRFVYGEFTAEMMLDTVWTLSHNNGPIFNKMILYGSYSQTLYRILDVQRSGQIPEAICFDHAISSYGVDLTHRMMWLNQRFPGKIGNFIDWYAVEALGSVNKYPGDKADQVKKHGVPAHVSEYEKQAALVAKAKAEKEAEEQKKAAEEAAAKKAEHAKLYYDVMPGVYVKKVQLRLAA